MTVLKQQSTYVKLQNINRQLCYFLVECAGELSTIYIKALFSSKFVLNTVCFLQRHLHGQVKQFCPIDCSVNARHSTCFLGGLFLWFTSCIQGCFDHIWLVCQLFLEETTETFCVYCNVCCETLAPHLTGDYFHCYFQDGPCRVTRPPFSKTCPLFLASCPEKEQMSSFSLCAGITQHSDHVM